MAPYVCPKYMDDGLHSEHSYIGNHLTSMDDGIHSQYRFPEVLEKPLLVCSALTQTLNPQTNMHGPKQNLKKLLGQLVSGSQNLCSLLIFYTRWKHNPLWVKWKFRANHLGPSRRGAFFRFVWILILVLQHHGIQPSKFSLWKVSICLGSDLVLCQHT